MDEKSNRRSLKYVRVAFFHDAKLFLTEDPSPYSQAFILGLFIYVLAAVWFLFCIYLIFVIFSNSLQTLTVTFYMANNENLSAEPAYFDFDFS